MTFGEHPGAANPGAANPGSITDLHSHLVPGVDDGARSVEDALEGIDRMVRRGVGHIVTTPHLDGALTRDPDALRRRLEAVDFAFREVVEAVSRRHPELRFGRGHEIMLDVPDPDLSDPRLRLAGSDYVLVEWPALQIPPETPRALRRLRDQGFRVLIAHPERYSGYDGELSVVERWREAGASLQVNCGALAGSYGAEARTRAFQMLERGWVDCLATDFHGRPRLRLYLESARRVFQELDAGEAWDLLTSGNPERIVKGEQPHPVPPVRKAGGLVGHLLSLLRPAAGRG